MRLATVAGNLRTAVGLDAPPPGRGVVAAAKALADWRVLLSLASVWVLISWGQSWRQAVKKWKVKSSPATWYAPYEFMSLDFLHNYQAGRFWVSGHNPYREDFQDPIGRKLCYPPVVVVCFAWCSLFAVKKAVAVWTVSLAGLAALGAVAAWRTRRELGLAPVPILVAVTAIVTSAPVAYAMERGNYDLLIVPLLMAMAWGLRRTGWRADAVVGIALGLAVCLKVYPGLLGVVLLFLGRWRAVGLTAAATVAFLAVQFQDLPIFVQNLRDLAGLMHEHVHKNYILAATHSITYTWRPLWLDSRLEVLTKIPGSVVAVGLVGGLLGWVGWTLRRYPKPDGVLLPVLLWAAAAATFVPRVANDYSLFFLPMAALAVWDRRDAVPVHVALGFLCVWAQPIAFGVSPSVVFGAKVLALIAVAAAIVSRLREQSAEPGVPAVVLTGTAVVPSPRLAPTTECCHVE